MIRKVKPGCIVLHSGFFLIDSTYIPLVPLLFSQKNDASYR
ncbi:putative membrane protein [Bacteroides fragilis str. S6L8]|nr:putative membrane protein [Bacteroides fragilis str. S36L5]EYB02148.1 putative membrane protein [Bacteroides fragilis str. S6L8]EYE57776.1 putative membrane protein [Bacteroides fragilis str. S6R8]